MPDIFEYNDFRAFLKDWLDEEEVRSGRELARQANVSPAQLSLVLNGKRRCTEDFASKLAGATDLVPAEREFLVLLALASDGKSAEARDGAAARLAAMRRFERKVNGSNDHYRIQEDWVHAAVLELAQCEGFRPDPVWIARTLRPRVDRARCRRSLDLLQEVGLMDIAPDGAVTVTTPIIHFGDGWPEDRIVRLMRHHAQDLLELGKDAVEQVPWTERNYADLAFATRRELLPRLVAEVEEFKRRVVELVLANDEPGDCVVQLNTQLFTLTRELPPRER